MRGDVQRRLVSEFLGTFWLVSGGRGSAVCAAAFPQLGTGVTGVSLFAGSEYIRQLWLFWIALAVCLLHGRSRTGPGCGATWQASLP